MPNHKWWLVQVNTVSSLQHPTMLQCDKAVLCNSSCLLFFLKNLRSFVKRLNAYSHCAAVDANAPLGLHILCRIQNVYMMATQEHVSLCITLLSCLTNS